MHEERILGFLITRKGAREIAAELLSQDSVVFGERSPKFVACYNPHSHVVAKRDAEFRQALENADVLLPDGAGVILASRVCGGSISARVTGFDIFSRLLAEASCIGGQRIFLLGSTEATLREMVERICNEYPNIVGVAYFSPPFTDEFSADQTHEMLKKINDFQPDILFVGMTAPKQEKWVETNKTKISSKVTVSIGAVFDFYAGNKKRAPSIFRSLYLEWLVRLAQEPMRLWRRTFVSAPIFLVDLIRFRARL